MNTAFNVDFKLLYDWVITNFAENQLLSTREVLNLFSKIALRQYCVTQEFKI